MQGWPVICSSTDWWSVSIWWLHKPDNYGCCLALADIIHYTVGPPPSLAMCLSCSQEACNRSYSYSPAFCYLHNPVSVFPAPLFWKTVHICVCSASRYSVLCSQCCKRLCAPSSLLCLCAPADCFSPVHSSVFSTKRILFFSMTPEYSCKWPAVACRVLF